MIKYSPAKAADANGDLSKRWYIYYYCWLPNAKGEIVRKRFREHGGVNYHKTKGARKKALEVLRDARNELLAAGWSPEGEYTLNEDFAIKFGLKGNIRECINKALKIKKAHLKKESFKFMEYRVKLFKHYLESIEFDGMPASEIKKHHITAFLRQVQHTRNLSARTRNNYLADLSALFTTMAEESLIEDNPCRYIKKLKTESEIHQPFTDADLTRIIKVLRENDPVLHLYVKFIVYPFLRPASTIKVQLRHLRIDECTIELPGTSEKTGKPMLKRLPKDFAEELRPFVEDYPNDYYLFSTECYSGEVIPGPAPATKDWFHKRFKKKVKKELGLTRFQTMYGLRHTYIRQLIEAGAPHESVMKITGHRTHAAFMAYLRDYHIIVPDDLSHLYRLKM